MSGYFYRQKRAPQASRFRTWGMIIAVVGLLSWMGINNFKNSLPSRIHTEFRAKLNQQLNPLGLGGDVQQIKFVEGRGFQLGGLFIHKLAENENDSILRIENGFVHAPATLTDLIAGHCSPSRITLENLKLTITRSANGIWELGGPLKQLMQQPCSSKPIGLEIHNGALEIVDQSTNPPKISTIKDIQLQLQPIVHNQRDLLQLTGSFAGIAISNIEFVAYVDPERKTWYTNLKTEQARISQGLLDFVPGLVGINNTPPIVDGAVQLRGTANGDFSGKQRIHFDLDGQIRGLSITDQRLPFPITQCDVDFSIQPGDVRLTRAKGRAGEATFDLEFQQDNLFDLDNWTLGGSVFDFHFTNEMIPWLTRGGKQFCKDFQPLGFSDFRFEIASSNGKLSRKVEAKVKDMSFNFHKFPYPMKHFAGYVNCVNDLFEFDLESDRNKNKFRVFGTARNPGPQSTYTVNVTADGKFPIDERLSEAMKPFAATRRQMLSFRPLGHVSGRGSFVKDRPDLASPSKNLEINFHDCTVQHEKFEYTIQQVNGTAILKGENLEFNNITGSNGTAKVRCDGVFNKTNGLKARFLCTDVPLDEQLRLAVSKDIRDVWSGFRPHGSVGLMKVVLNLPYGSRSPNIGVEADLASTRHSEATKPYTSSVSIKPVWFPYDINNLAGQIRVSDGQISLAEMKGMHRRTWLSWQGNGAYSKEGWSVSLRNLLVGALRVDEELLTALPRSLVPPISQLEFEGLLNVNGEITLGGRHENGLVNTTPTRGQQNQVVQVGFNEPLPANDSTEMFWDLRFDMNQAKMQLGIPVTNLFGMVQLRGSYDGQTANCAGELAVDSMTVHDAQIKNVRGPIWIDETGVTAGTLAANQISKSEPRQVVGEVFGGAVRFDGQRLADEHGRFFVQASLTNGDLAEVVDEFAPHLEKVKGRMFGGFRLSGDDTGTHTYRGEGNMKFRDAEIYELPVILSLLKILRVKEATRTAFDTSDVDFTINGNTIDFGRIEMIGDAISLIGNGRINFKRQIDLNFYSVMGRNRFYIPILSELYRAGSKRILWINVDGSLENPQTHRNVLPQLNDSIRMLLRPRQNRTNFGLAPTTDSNLLDVFEARNPNAPPSLNIGRN